MFALMSRMKFSHCQFKIDPESRLSYAIVMTSATRYHNEQEALEYGGDRRCIPETELRKMIDHSYDLAVQILQRAIRSTKRHAAAPRRAVAAKRRVRC